MIAGRATAEGTERFRARHPEAAEAGHFRRLGGLSVSSIGLGTYLGVATAEVDGAYEEAILAALAAGCNVFDTAVNYRHQRSERVLGRALGHAFERGLVERDEVVVCSKGGFLPFDGEQPGDPAGDLERRYLDSALVPREELVAGCHSLAPDYLLDQIVTSRANLGLETIDLYYLHNPEMQLQEVDRDALAERLLRAFGCLATACERGEIGGFGAATWAGLRLPSGSPGALSLAALRELAGEGMVAVQAPINLAMPEAVVAPTQTIDDVVVPLAVATRHLGLGLFASASILQGGFDAAASIGDALGPDLTAPQRALQFTRSLPGVTTALVGMASVEHVRENLELARREPAAAQDLQALFEH